MTASNFIHGRKEEKKKEKAPLEGGGSLDLLEGGEGKGVLLKYRSREGNPQNVSNQQRLTLWSREKVSFRREGKERIVRGRRKKSSGAP